MKFATCNEYFENWAIEDVFNYAADLGYDGVEIAPFALGPSVEDISAARRDEIRAAAEKLPASTAETKTVISMLDAAEAMFCSLNSQIIC